jgi:hypothetical protein
MLTASSVVCPSGDDAGTTVDPYGVQLCNYLSTRARPAVFAGLFDCLQGVNITPCSDTYADAAGACVGNVFGQACDEPAQVTLDSGTMYGCADVATACAAEAADAGTPDAGDAGATRQPLDQVTCQKYANGLTDDARIALFNCFQQSTGANCNDRFAACLLNF